MKKLHTFAFYALVTPVITLGAGSLLAQDYSDPESEEQSAQGGWDGAENTGHSQMELRGYIGSAPANGMHASALMGATVTTIGDEDVGSVTDLIIDENGQIVAVVVGVGGFLGLGEKNVAIGWDDATTSADADDLELRIEQTREALAAAPEFEEQE